jgi:hypothetical protein
LRKLASYDATSLAVNPACQAVKKLASDEPRHTWPSRVWSIGSFADFCTASVHEPFLLAG